MIESPKLKTTERYYFLDVIRLILALIVCYEHTKIASQEASTIAAYIAVDIFFILSGYVLCQQIQNISYRDFVISRIARMFPLYWVSMLILYFLWNNVHPFDPNYFYNTITEFFFIALGWLYRSARTKWCFLVAKYRILVKRDIFIFYC